jgi:hypothetical protein
VYEYHMQYSIFICVYCLLLLIKDIQATVCYYLSSNNLNMNKELNSITS